MLRTSTSRGRERKCGGGGDGGGGCEGAGGGGGERRPGVYINRVAAVLRRAVGVPRAGAASARTVKRRAWRKRYVTRYSITGEECKQS